MGYKTFKTIEWQDKGGTLIIPDGWFVYMVDLDCQEPYATICKDDDSDEVATIFIPKALAYYLSTHFCGSEVMRELIVEDTRRSIANVVKGALGL